MAARGHRAPRKGQLIVVGCHRNYNLPRLAVGRRQIREYARERHVVGAHTVAGARIPRYDLQRDVDDIIRHLTAIEESSHARRVDGQDIGQQHAGESSID